MVNIGIQNRDRSFTKQWSAGLYLRLSRDDDKYESESISSQRDIIQDFVDRNSDITVYDTYVDDGWSGTNFDRPNFKRMEDDLRAKKIDCIIVKDLSRFARNCIEIGNYLSIVFPYLKTRFICINDNVDSYLDPESLDNLSTKFKNLINDEYCRDISVKVRSSLTVRRENGDYIGSFPCYGYQKDPEDYHKLIIDEVSAQYVRLIFRKFVAGESIRAIIRYLNAESIPTPAAYKKSKHPKYKPSNQRDNTWSYRTVRRILSSRMYVGDMVQNVMNNISYRIQKCRPVEKEKQIIVPNTHEAIISRETFDKAQDLLSRDTYESGKTQQQHVLSGFIKCGDCKRGMIKRTVNNGWKTYRYFLCSTFKNRSPLACTKHTINADKVEEAVFAFIKMHIALALDIEPVLDLINRSPERAKKSERLVSLRIKYEEELEKNKRLREDLYPDFKMGLIDQREYEMFRNKYEIKMQEIEKSIADTDKKLKEIENGVSVENAFIKNFLQYKSLTELTREVVGALIENVYVYENERIEIVMKFRDEFEALVEYIENNLSVIPKIIRKQLDVILPSAMATVAEGAV